TDPADQVQEQAFLGLEVVIDRALGEAGNVRHLLQAGVGIPLLRKEPQCRYFDFFYTRLAGAPLGNHYLYFLLMSSVAGPSARSRKAIPAVFLSQTSGAEVASFSMARCSFPEGVRGWDVTTCK